ncbi:MAG: dihydroorotate dehydrogenase electron transfer subunit [Bacteroidetes bacterium]|nr:dihydroorotate dehydrogenase electron transfer subunit [Bacteroidota bacterium]
MNIAENQIDEIIELEYNIHLFKVISPEIARKINPGEFLNIRISELAIPLFRRPFSVCDVEDDCYYLMFSTMGTGTKLLASKKPGDFIDVLGPLGNGFNIVDDFDRAIIIGGGLGVAPFPFLTRKLKGKKEIISLIGGRTKKDVITYGLENISVATEDGSLGFKGNVIELLEKELDKTDDIKSKIFACGPIPMLKALKILAEQNNIDCEISTECTMACGFGICQGCPIQSSADEDKYLLVCKDGPVFNSKEIIL